MLAASSGEQDQVLELFDLALPAWSREADRYPRGSFSTSTLFFDRRAHLPKIRTV